MEKIGRIERYLKKAAMPIANADAELYDAEGAKLIDHAHHLSSMEPGEEDLTRAYHSPMSSGSRSWVQHPINGWATVASNSLYNAAGLKDLVEDINVHEKEGAPVTARKLLPGYKTLFTLKSEQSNDDPIRKSIDPLQVWQIAAMDFLMGNNDRHLHNLLVSDQTNDQGYNPLLAVNHGRNFQYFKGINQIRPKQHFLLQDEERKDYDSPSDYIKHSALGPAMRASWKADPSAFRSWWIENADAIKASFDDQTEMIKDERIKSHIQKNFDRRFAMLQQWAQDKESGDFFDEDYPNVVRNIPKPRAAPEVIDAIRERLPKDNPAQAIEFLSDAFSKKRSLNTQHKLYDTFRELVKDLSAEDLVNLYDKYRGQKDAKMGRNPLGFELLKSVINNRHRPAARALLDYDESRGKLLHGWKEVLERIARGRR